jgi:hypothetical protein
MLHDYSGLGAIPLSNIRSMGGEYEPLGRRHSGKGRAVPVRCPSIRRSSSRGADMHDDKAGAQNEHRPRQLGSRLCGRSVRAFAPMRDWSPPSVIFERWACRKELRHTSHRGLHGHLYSAGACDSDFRNWFCAELPNRLKPLSTRQRTTPPHPAGLYAPARPLDLRLEQ